MSAGGRKYPTRLAPVPARNATPTARIVCDVLLLVWLGVLVTFLLGAYTGVLP